MTSTLNRVLINDRYLPETQKCVLKYAIAQNNHKLELIFTSDLDLDYPKHWQVKPEVAFSLAAKLWAIANPQKSEKTLYLDGNCLINGDLSLVFHQSSQSIFLSTQIASLAKLTFLMIDGDKLDRNLLIQLSCQDYSQIADFEDLNCHLLQPDLTAMVIDCISIGDRPWYSIFAPQGRVWMAQVKTAIEQEYLSLDCIERDINRGWLRPSLREQLKAGIEDSFVLTPEIAALDECFTPPELAVTPAQLQVITSTIFPLPKRIWSRVIFSGYFWEIEFPQRKLQVQRLLEKIWHT
ncbi:hypothetical protein [Merismopedia glauca]|uniref:Uncharacterized protein n=1 Tax=Merismopedia glauca CCAP 1448/3 TaxID=1296344 RepID=A0A2T1C7K3_9CYAN|nr:hypothetical protein [Merismopedia glauca]PSB04138.1 hypothetical protein C7B64_05200 [Merismopedia glauca CCAP 1448/3]